MVDEDLAEAVAAVLRRRMKQQEGHFLACGNGQHLLTSVNEPAIMVGRVFDLLSVVRGFSFCLGLILVVVGGAELFTLNNLLDKARK